MLSKKWRFRLAVGFGLGPILGILMLLVDAYRKRGTPFDYGKYSVADMLEGLAFTSGFAWLLISLTLALIWFFEGISSGKSQ